MATYEFLNFLSRLKKFWEKLGKFEHRLDVRYYEITVKLFSYNNTTGCWGMITFLEGACT